LLDLKYNHREYSYEYFFGFRECLVGIIITKLYSKDLTRLL